MGLKVTIRLNSKFSKQIDICNNCYTGDNLLLYLCVKYFANVKKRIQIK